MPHDLLIKNGTVIDGSGAPAFRADVAVRAGKVAAVGRIRGAADETIDAEGLVVSPGFIDMHTHYDAQLCWDPLATSSSWHGVTTVVTGNCGYGIAPTTESGRAYTAALMAHVEGISLDVLNAGVDWDWETFGDFLRRLERNRLGVNVAAQVPHSPLRYYVMGEAAYERESTPEELERMKGELRRAMADGAIGFSTLQAEGRIGAWGKPIPSELATFEELHGLASVLGEVNAGVINISPRPGTSTISPEYREFLIAWSRDTGRPVVWGQFMHRWDQPDMWRELLGFMDDAKARGASIYALAKCQSLDLEFTLQRTDLFATYPTWRDVLAKPGQERKRLLADPGVRAKLRSELEPQPGALPARRPESLEVRRTVLAKNKALEGRRLVDLAESGQHVDDVLLDLALEEDLETRFVFTGVMNGDPDAVGQMIQSEHCLPGSSDAGAHLDMDCGVDYTSLLLGHWVRDKHVMGLEEGVRRLTSMPASVLGLTDRGLLKEGMAADIVVFNRETISALPREIVNDLPGGAPRIVQRAVGVAAVIVNGQTVFRDGVRSGAMPGAILGAVGTGAAGTPSAR